MISRHDGLRAGGAPHADTDSGVPETEEGKKHTPGKAAATAQRQKCDVDFLLECLQEAKAEDIVTIDLKDKSPLADYMMIASGRSHRHVGAIAERLIRLVKTHTPVRARSEGLPACDWVLIDCGDIVVHLFRPEVRAFYELEKMWSFDARPTTDEPERKARAS